MSKPWLLSALLLVSAAAGCGGSGMGKQVRADVTARMQTAEPALASCYGAALQRNRKLRGMLVLSITAEAKTGQFKNVTLTRDELGDTELRKCVLDEIAEQRLEKPQSTNITFTYPLRFAPTK